MTSYDFCMKHGHVWTVKGQYPADNNPYMVWTWEECTRCGTYRKAAKFHDLSELIDDGDVNG